MPAAATPEENYQLLYAIVKCSGVIVNTDWDEVAKMTGLTKSAVTQRFAKIKKAMDTEEDDGNSTPRPATKKRATGIADGGDPWKKQRKKKVQAETEINKEADVTGEDGENDEQV